MNLEDLVISFDQAKKLKELGVDVESYAFWQDCPHCEGPELQTGVFIPLDDGIKLYRAYTSAEIGKIIKQNTPYAPAFSCNTTFTGEYIFEYVQRMKNDPNVWDVDRFVSKLETEAQARAEFLLFLLENKE